MCCAVPGICRLLLVLLHLCGALQDVHEARLASKIHAKDPCPLSTMSCQAKIGPLLVRFAPRVSLNLRR
jgi:hypothetical protein